MAGFSESYQNRFNRKWKPVQQIGTGKKFSKKRHPEKQEIESGKRPMKYEQQKKASTPQSYAE